MQDQIARRPVRAAAPLTVVGVVLALGLALIFGVMRVINIAHGPLLMLGAYVTYFLYSRAGLNPFLTVPISMAVLFVVGLLLQRTLVFRVVNAPELSSLLLTFGISIALVNLAWALGHAVGAPLCGWLADRAGDGVTYLAFAALCLGVLGTLRTRHLVPVTLS